MKRKAGVVVAVSVAAVALLVLLVSSPSAQGGRGFVVSLSSTGEVLISDQDVSFYNSTSRELGLTPGCISRLSSMDLYHRAFLLTLDGRPLGNGSLWADMDSMPPPSGLSMLDIVAIQRGFATDMRFEACYPSGYYTNCTAPDLYGALESHFRELGKLVT